MINSTVNPPKVFWAVAVIALFYSIIGILSFLSECFVTDEIYNVLTDDERYIYENRPFWLLIVFGVDVFAGTTASLFLLLRKIMAFKLGLISIIATTIQILYFYFYSNISNVIGPTSMQMPLIIFAISFMLLLFIKYSIIKRWLA
ncbi:hypothetical protein [Maribacter sp. 1_2014MBL_MicDiv]|uniref:hypothetical protein n=1 Tax=Maribacter sp. 1_2014MBL_MicDiv TaxID=1644130 RepID=UPI0008F45F12|nr:hypothetical protein [Maribacter sp. 1_2014MBL_MicDiv]APA65867.1 hypothetical protein YQ22_17040 [Maribacter sp. 1_2014MBL_MicDiv]